MIDTAHCQTLLRGADMILQSAQEDGLPQVRLVSVHEEVEIQLDGPDQVRAWADWRGLEVTRRPLTKTPGRELVECRGSMYEVPFQVYTSAAVEQPEVTCARCSHTARQHTGIGCMSSIGAGKSCPCSRTSGSVELDAINAETAGAAR